MISPAECKTSHRQTIIIPCRQCRKGVDTGVTWEEGYRYFSRSEPIQTALPHVSSDLRGMFISGTCPKCWDKMFGEDDRSYWERDAKEE